MQEDKSKKRERPIIFTIDEKGRKKPKKVLRINRRNLNLLRNRRKDISSMEEAHRLTKKVDPDLTKTVELQRKAFLERG